MTVATTTYTNASVEWWHTSEHGTVALRPGGGQVSHFCEFSNAMGVVVATAAGMAGKTVDFTTSGESGGFWRNVTIKAVH